MLNIMEYFKGGRSSSKKSSKKTGAKKSKTDSKKPSKKSSKKNKSSGNASTMQMAGAAVAGAAVGSMLSKPRKNINTTRASNQVASNKVASNQVASNQVASNQVASNQVASNKVASNQIATTQVATTSSTPCYSQNNIYCYKNGSNFECDPLIGETDFNLRNNAKNVLLTSYMNNNPVPRFNDNASQSNYCKIACSRDNTCSGFKSSFNNSSGIYSCTFYNSNLNLDNNIWK